MKSTSVEPISATTFADSLIQLLIEEGYSHCFFVPGGNIMHLLNSARKNMTCIPFVHEHSAVVATEYFNELRGASAAGKAFALVTVGPGVTNAVTGVAGAFLESRECLVIGGQVKQEDLSPPQIRQIGIQELDGAGLMRSVCKVSLSIGGTQDITTVRAAVRSGATPRRGPVFVEVPLDVQGSKVSSNRQSAFLVASEREELAKDSGQFVKQVWQDIQLAERPILLIGGGVSYDVAYELHNALARLGIPIMTTWNGFDRVPDSHPMFIGRPNNWGQRAANIILAQADLVIAVGTRLGIQQTGFRADEWTMAKVIQVDLDQGELWKQHPQIHLGAAIDADSFLRSLTDFEADFSDWLAFCLEVKTLLPIAESSFSQSKFVNPSKLISSLNSLLTSGDRVVPASSGSGQFLPMQQLRIPSESRVITNKGLASMGYGLAGAIGSALADDQNRTILIEGDGSFAQNLQELGTVSIQNLPIKVILLSNDGYASIRATQKRHFDGRYMGCDRATGLGLPHWGKLTEAFEIPHRIVTEDSAVDEALKATVSAPGPQILVVKIDPEYDFAPKVGSSINPNGGITSDPVYDMQPRLPEKIAKRVVRFPIPVPLTPLGPLR